MSPSANHANSPSLDTARCPLCGGPNRCALAAAPSATECWCDSLEFPRELFAQIPDDAVRKTCVCQKSSDTDEIGWRSGVDAGSGSVSIALGGSEVCGYLGMLDSSMLQVPENLILDHEICMEVYDYYQEFNFDDYDMALDVIKAVEPRAISCVKNTRENTSEISDSQRCYAPRDSTEKRSRLKKPPLKSSTAWMQIISQSRFLMNLSLNWTVSWPQQNERRRSLKVKETRNAK